MTQEIEEITLQDETIRNQLARKEKTQSLIKYNKETLEKSLCNLEDFINKSASRGFSPNYKLNRSNNNNN